MSPHENPEGDWLLQWWPIPPAFLVDVDRVNLNDVIHCTPGRIIRAHGFDGLPVVPLCATPAKFYPIEDEL